VSNNFPARRNPARGARIDGGVAEAEVAGGSPRKKPPGSSPRKKPCSEGTFLLRLDQAKATAERGRTEPIELEGDLEEWAEGGRPRKAPPKTTKPPPITQEDDGYDDLASEEEKFDEDDVDDEEFNANGIAPRDEARRFVEFISARPRGAKQDDGANDGSRPKENVAPRDEARCFVESILARPHGAKRDDGANDGGRPKEDDPRDEARHVVESISARPRGAKRDNGANDGSRPKEDDGEEIDASRGGVTRKAIPASPRGTKREGGKNDQNNSGGRPKNSLKTAGDDEELDAGDIGDLDNDNEGPDYGDIEAQVAAEGAAARRWMEDVAVQARAALAWEPRGHPPLNFVRPDQPYDVAARALSALRDDEPYRNPRVVQDYGMESDEEAKAPPPPLKCRRRCVGRPQCSRRPISRPNPPPSVGGVV